MWGRSRNRYGRSNTSSSGAKVASGAFEGVVNSTAPMIVSSMTSRSFPSALFG